MSRRKLEELNLMDDFLFCTMMNAPYIGEQFGKKLLKIIFGRAPGRLTIVPQKVYYGSDTDKHGTRLDVYLEEGEGSDATIYDVEPDMKAAADDVASLAWRTRYYHAIIDEKVVGVGSISSFWGSLTESILLTIFVIPELHGQGIGRFIINTVEHDELFTRASRIEIPASITAVEFYRKQGYDYKNGIRELDEEGHFRLEKRKI